MGVAKKDQLVFWVLVFFPAQRSILSKGREEKQNRWQPAYAEVESPSKKKGKDGPQHCYCQKQDCLHPPSGSCFISNPHPYRNTSTCLTGIAPSSPAGVNLFHTTSTVKSPWSLPPTETLQILFSHGVRKHGQMHQASLEPTRQFNNRAEPRTDCLIPRLTCQTQIPKGKYGYAKLSQLELLQMSQVGNKHKNVVRCTYCLVLCQQGQQ